MSLASPSRVFVELVPWAGKERENTLAPDGEALPGSRRLLQAAARAKPGAAHELHVSGAAEVSSSPDRAQVTVRVRSTKEAAAEAKLSVGRRLDYITQSLRQQGLQVSGAWRPRRHVAALALQGPGLCRGGLVSSQFDAECLSFCIPFPFPGWITRAGR